jgi:amidase
LIGTDGAIPISSRQDVIGTLTRTVRDAAYLLSEMAGRSDRDEATWKIPFHPIPDFTTFCRGNDLSGITIGVPRNTWIGNSPAAIEASFESALETMRSAGANVVENADFPNVEDFKKLNMEVKGIVRSSEFKRDIARYFQTLETNPNNLHSAEDIIEFTKSFPAEDYPERDIGKFLWSQAEGVDVNSEKYKKMVEQEQFFGGEGGILGAMEKYNLDVLVIPADQDIANDLAAKMGFPAISVPLGFWPEDTPVKLKKDKSNLVAVAPGMP